MQNKNDNKINNKNKTAKKDNKTQPVTTIYQLIYIELHHIRYIR